MVHPGRRSTKAYPRALVVLGGGGRWLVLATKVGWGRGPHVGRVLGMCFPSIEPLAANHDWISSVLKIL